jgi:hypothetical protein
MSRQKLEKLRVAHALLDSTANTDIKNAQDYNYWIGTTRGGSGRQEYHRRQVATWCSVVSSSFLISYNVHIRQMTAAGRAPSLCNAMLHPRTPPRRHTLPYAVHDYQHYCFIIKCGSLLYLVAKRVIQRSKMFVGTSIISDPCGDPAGHARMKACR